MSPVGARDLPVRRGLSRPNDRPRRSTAASIRPTVPTRPRAAPLCPPPTAAAWCGTTRCAGFAATCPRRRTPRRGSRLARAHLRLAAAERLVPGSEGRHRAILTRHRRAVGGDPHDLVHRRHARRDLRGPAVVPEGAEDLERRRELPQGSQPERCTARIDRVEAREERVGGGAIGGLVHTPGTRPPGVVPIPEIARRPPAKILLRHSPDP